MRTLFVIGGLAVLGAIGNAKEASEAVLRLWYRQPAEVWTEALPIGNGSLGAMVFGGVTQERLQINEDTLWTGQPHEYHRPGAVEVLPELRRLLREGKRAEAEALAMERFMSVPLRQMMYQPFCDILLEFPGQPEPADYERELDLDRGITSVRYTSEGVRYTREAFSSYPDRILVQRITADRAGALDFSVRLTSPHAASEVRAVGDRRLNLHGRVGETGTRFAAGLVVTVEGGLVEVAGDQLRIVGATAATLQFSAATAFVDFRDVSGDPEAKVEATLATVRGKSHQVLEAAHVADYQRLFRRVSLDLGVTEAARRPTDERLFAAQPAADPALVTLLFNYGRYLLIASSRPGSQPANLQGIWNDQLNPPWGSKYTTNINAEMNYWPAEVANLSECAEPLFGMIRDLV
ncbi:MAG TPA: glycoside hydrolase family 95 protein, partial [Candidatus Synoicihabitans sp.]|nr:glycoside hydrolase family 95 protein [Candidatus Synoicihabitans sp.]